MYHYSSRGRKTCSRHVDVCEAAAGEAVERLSDPRCSCRRFSRPPSKRPRGNR